MTELKCLSDRLEYSINRMDQLVEFVKKDEFISRLDDICVYITGSYGRGEAHSESDVDIFFVKSGSEETNKFTNVDKALLDAAIIKICRDLGFPEFTGGGEYLNIHYVDDILSELGGPKDDFLNYFTARMLLLLESKPIILPDLYDQIIGQMIDSYYRDYHEHESEFIPVFLVNDIHRYWRTMCLNYEHRRNRTRVDKNKSHIKNFKLKFSRMLTCFSMIACIHFLGNQCSKEEILKIVKLSPLERLDLVADAKPDLAPLIFRMKKEYNWFMERTGRPNREVVKWISNRRNRDSAFARARKFGDMFYELLQKISGEDDTVRYLVI